ncbi:FKBP-type peptidyl-prolyl cis-trans isomerase [Mangrovibacterium sp.]|uniref:FKBP-type peptidyl-prolyl cis-trans isomerase n=1 Tax=Mangrovibacterium sp. TaxID=1961364 RepID=UPI0035674796
MKNYWKIGLFAFVAVVMVACNDDDYESQYTEENEQQLLTELLDNLIENGRDIDTTKLGVYYMVDQLGEGPLVQAGDSIGINYNGYFVTGSLFDSSSFYGDGTYRYVYKSVDMITGFDDAVGTLQEGGVGTFIIPSGLAYGVYGYSSIPPYSTLVFEIELVAIYPPEVE